MSLNLFLDDIRYPKNVTWVELPLVEWTIVRSYNEFIKAVESNHINMVSFDHDIGPQSYQEFHRANNSDKIIKYENLVEKTGFDCAKFLAHYCIDKGMPIPIYYVHTMNPIGKENIISILENAKRIIDERTT